MSDDTKGTTGCPAHCDHLSHTLTVSPPIEVWVCCHCGRTREVRLTATGGTTHGPYVPGWTTYLSVTK